MATSTFDKTFVIRSKKAAKIIYDALERTPSQISTKRDVEKELDKGAKLLHRRLFLLAK